MNLFTLSRKFASSLIAVCTLSSLISCGSDDRAIAFQPPTAGAYTVGGTVSGLFAPELVLANGSDTVSISGGGTAFTFPTSVAAGAGYEVTVATQPAGQTCAVGNGSGTVQSANITTVAVSCIANTFSLGGTVSGLTGSGLVLVNGDDTVAVAAGAKTFTLPAAIDTGSRYAVTVQTQPSGQTCTVANGSGTMQSANVANVVVTCAVKAFSLGGTVSGLNGPGLVLANGSDTVGVSVGAKTFTLPTAVATGSSYTVTVETQPTGEACTVTNGMGTMAGVAISNVSVTCTDQPFNLGGSITGLTSAGLVLANGSDTLTVAANAASFTMPTQVKYDSTYAVTVKTQPTGLTCSVSAGSGTMPAKAVTTVVLACSPQAYALGGTVIGLTTGSVVLTDGTDTITLNAGATTFSLPTHIAFGSHYALSIQTQPVGLICSLGGNSSGTMPAAAVSVVMTCSPSSYTLGGSITGLTGIGLVLANGSDTLTVAALAAQFTMHDSVALGSTYRVTVTASPVGEWCTLAGGSGTATANVDISSAVQITCTAITLGTLTPWTVPSGVTSIQVVATGGGGGGGGPSPPGGPAGASGGNGAIVTAVLSVQPGDSINFYAGGGGGVSTEGGGGGGMTYLVNTNNMSNFVIAGGGGGGGAGGGGSGGTGGNAGSPGNPSTSNGGGGMFGSSGNGGSGGVGGPGSPLCPPEVCPPFPPCYPDGCPGADGGSSTADPITAGSGSGGNGNPGSCTGPGCDPSLGGAGISGTIGNGGSGGIGWGGGGGGGGYGGGGAGGNGGVAPLPNGGGGGGGGGSTGPTGTTYAVAPSGSAGAGGAGGVITGVAGNDGSLMIILNP